jgi:hypothetical protein
MAAWLLMMIISYITNLHYGAAGRGVLLLLLLLLGGLLLACLLAGKSNTIKKDVRREIMHVY